MGYGDELMSTGFARGAAARGKRIAFGDGEKIIWNHNSESIFRGNPNIALPGSERDCDIEWIRFYRGYRIYNTPHPNHQLRRWVWNTKFKPVPGEVFFTDEELAWAHQFGRDYVVIEPNVPRHKPVAQNKQWPTDRYQRLATTLRKDGIDVRQFHYGPGFWLDGAKPIRTPSFRHALAALRNARLVVTSEGGLHHGAAAVGIPAVVIFGGFIPPEVTGYPGHENLAHGEACGNWTGCDHCRVAMKAISLEQVIESTRKLLDKTADLLAD